MLIRNHTEQEDVIEPPSMNKGQVRYHVVGTERMHSNTTSSRQLDPYGIHTWVGYRHW